MCFSPYLGIGHAAGGGGGYAVFHPGSSKIKVSETYLYDTVITQNDHPSYVKHFSCCIHVFFTLFGYWVRGGGGQTGLVHNLLTQFFSLYSSKIEVSETYFF